jgi:nickel-dependent lactate racemase
MRNVTLPYGDGSLTFKIPEKNLLAIAEPADVAGTPDTAAAVRAAIRRPVGTRPLREQIRKGMKVVIVFDDFTRPTPAYRLLPALLDELDPTANRLDIKLLNAAGTHRPMTDAELTAKVGAEVMAHYPVLNHDAYNEAELVFVGKTKNGTPIHINRLVMQADLVIGISNVVPHNLAGWSGGAKIIQPGCCGAETTNLTHAIAMMSPTPHVGRLDNPLRVEVEQVVDRAKLNFFSINVILNGHSDVVQIVAGHPTQSHRVAVEASEKVWVVPIPALPDIIVASSYPANVDFWQGSKGLYACEPVIKRGGDIIMATPCPERIAIHEHTATMRALKGLSSRAARHEAVRRGVKDLTAVNVVVWLGRLNELAWVSLYSDGLTDDDLDVLGFARAHSIQSALDIAFKRQGPDAQVLVVTHGGELCPVLRV